MVRPILIAAFMLASLAFGRQLGTWHGALMARLREQHPDTWQLLGRPPSARAGWTWTTLSFLFSCCSQTLGDPQFAADARQFRRGFLLWPVAGVAVVVLDGLLLH